MSWWKKALYDPCSLVTLDKILLDRPKMSVHFSKGVLALEEGFHAERMEDETIRRIRKRVTLISAPSEAGTILAISNLPRSISDIDRMVYATAVQSSLSVVTADERLAKALSRKSLRVGNMAIVLRALVENRAITRKASETILIALAARHDFLLRHPKPCWKHLKAHTFPE